MTAKDSGNGSALLVLCWNTSRQHTSAAKIDELKPAWPWFMGCYFTRCRKRQRMSADIGHRFSKESTFIDINCHSRAMTAKDSGNGSLATCALGYNERDVVYLFVRAELPELAHEGSEQLLRIELAVLLQGFQQTLFAKFLSRKVRGLRCAVGVQHEGVAWAELTLFNRAIPALKQAHHRGVR